ncbi:MAG: hypothetical protein CM1200mP26_26570 [Acidimicrobiales bacterium]|nr:MAG: hypothetical protein CM1200mP26_26570 [Acidimicrobiales bacterium]
MVVSVGLEAWLGLASDLDTARAFSTQTGRRCHSVIPSGSWVGSRASVPCSMVSRSSTPKLLTYETSMIRHSTRPGHFHFPNWKSPLLTLRISFERPVTCVSPGVFATDEVDIMLDEAEILADEARPGDMTSWWGRDGNGTEVLTRVLRAASRPSLNALIQDRRVRQIVEIADEELSPSVDDGPESVDRVTVLWKRPGMTDGLGDLPWHRDCGMGGHANRCPSTVLTICLTAGSAEAGELRFLPGSHRGSFPFVDGKATEAPTASVCQSVPVT